MQDLNKLAIFVRAMDAGSFTRAARFLKQPKSRVARHVAALEKELGVSLIYRTTRQFSPTEAGRALHERCRELVYALDGATGTIRENPAEVTGRLRLTAAPDFGSLFLGSMIAALQKVHPKVEVELHLTNDYVDLVREGMDLAIRIGSLQDAGLKSRLIGQVAMMAVASPSYLKRSPRLREPADLANHSLLHFATDGADLAWRLQSRSGHVETILIQPRTSANHPQVLLDLAVAGQGVALIPEFLCTGELKKKRLRRVLEGYVSERDPIHFVWPAQRETSAKVRAFVDLGVKRLSPAFR